MNICFIKNDKVEREARIIQWKNADSVPLKIIVNYIFATIIILKKRYAKNFWQERLTTFSELKILLKTGFTYHKIGHSIPSVKTFYPVFSQFHVTTMAKYRLPEVITYLFQFVSKIIDVSFLLFHN